MSTVGLTPPATIDCLSIPTLLFKSLKLKYYLPALCQHEHQPPFGCQQNLETELLLIWFQYNITGSWKLRALILTIDIFNS